MSIHEINEESEATEAKSIARPEPDGEQLPLFDPGKSQEVEDPDPGRYLNEYGFPNDDWPGWDLGPTRFKAENPEEFELVARFARETWGMELV